MKLARKKASQEKDDGTILDPGMSLDALDVGPKKRDEEDLPFEDQATLTDHLARRREMPSREGREPALPEPKDRSEDPDYEDPKKSRATDWRKLAKR